MLRNEEELGTEDVGSRNAHALVNDLGWSDFPRVHQRKSLGVADIRGKLRENWLW